MLSEESRSMRIFALVTVGLMLIGISMLAQPAIGNWAIPLALLACIILVRAILLAAGFGGPRAPAGPEKSIDETL